MQLDRKGVAVGAEGDVRQPRVADSEPQSYNRDGSCAATKFSVGQVVRTSVAFYGHAAGSRVRITHTGEVPQPYDYSGVFVDTDASYAFMEDELANDWPIPTQDDVTFGSHVQIYPWSPNPSWTPFPPVASAPIADGEAPFGAAVDALYAESENLLLTKHADYGPRNVSQSPGGPLMGLAVRLHDKLARLSNLLATGAEPEHESLRDTMLDIMGYGAIGVLVVDGSWPE